jgi:hypothetical protein
MPFEFPAQRMRDSRLEWHFCPHKIYFFYPSKTTRVFETIHTLNKTKEIIQ